MKLLTAEIREAFKKRPLYSQDGAGDDAIVVAKFFDPCGRFTFYAIEGTEEEGDVTMFGYVRSPLGEDCDGLSYVSLNEMKSVTNKLGLGVERDLHFPVAKLTLAEAKGR